MPPVPVTLEGNLVRLEPLSFAHLRDLCEVGLDPSIWRWNTRRMVTGEDMRAYVEDALGERERGESIPFAIVLRDSGRAIGSTRYGAISPRHRRLEIGWTWIGTSWQRTGVNSECKLLLMRHAFEDLACLRLELKTDTLNEPSRRAILRLGAREEGTLRSHMIAHDGRIRDTVYYSILSSEWPAVREALLQRIEAHRDDGRTGRLSQIPRSPGGRDTAEVSTGPESVRRDPAGDGVTRGGGSQSR